MSEDYQNLLFQTNDAELSFVMKTYNVSEKMFDESIERLEDWYKLQPHLPKISIEKRFLQRVIATNGFSIEKAKTKLDNLFRCRSQLPEYFSERLLCNGNMKNVFEFIDCVFMPKMTEDRHRITILRIRDSDPNLFDPIEMYKIAYTVCDLETWYDTMVGLHLVWDCTYVKFGHIVKITPVMVKKFLFILQQCYGAKLKSIHILNATNYMNTLINAVKVVLKKKIADRVYTHQTLEDLHKQISPEYLPKELGGSQKSYDELTGFFLFFWEYAKDIFCNALKSPEIMKVLTYLDQLKSDETKRINTKENAIDDILGITGTFKKLDID